MHGQTQPLCMRPAVVTALIWLQGTTPIRAKGKSTELLQVGMAVTDEGIVLSQELMHLACM